MVKEFDVDPVEPVSGPVSVEVGAEELISVFTKIATGGPGNVYSIGGLSICGIINDALEKMFDDNMWLTFGVRIPGSVSE